ncbi:MAG: hypothetical protein AABX29_03480 [Nanoarchaeota archaeon]
MRNTRLYIIIAVIVLIIVGIITSFLSNQLKKGGEAINNDKNTNKIETSGTRTLSRTEKYREAARITKQSNTSLLSDDQVKRFNTLSEEVSSGQGGTINGENFDIGYSNITNLFCVQKKTPQGDLEFTKYLTEKQTLDIYEKDPSLFVITDENCSEYLKKQEEYIVQDLEIDGETNSEEEDIIKNKQSTATPSYSTKILQNLTTLTDLIKILQPLDLQAPEELQNNSTQQASLGNASSKGYYKMPNAPNGEYVFGGWNRCDSHKYGSKALIDAIFTAALRWKAKYPQYTFRIGDLTGADVKSYPGQGHQSHHNGVDVDIVTYGNWNLQINAPIEVNIDLGKAFIDTGIIKLIIFGGAVFNKNAPIVQNAWKVYANSKGLPFQTYALGNHDNHFHVRINDQFRGPVDAPGPCR